MSRLEMMVPVTSSWATRRWMPSRASTRPLIPPAESSTLSTPLTMMLAAMSTGAPPGRTRVEILPASPSM